ncbi:MAG: right-handed parallel beta-helix repeat-containing protein, partial [Planctomycetota bacterium]
MYRKIRRICIQIIMSCLLLAGFSQRADARSVYAITNHTSSIITAYDVNGTAIDYQTDVEVHWGAGAVGLALDPDSETLFATYDGAFKIQLIDARAMEEIKYISTTDELAGVVFDSTNQRLYALSRGAATNNLYIYLWDPLAKNLTCAEGSPKTLTNLAYPYAFGLALNEDGEHLFVTDKSNAVKYYDTSDPNFGYLGAVSIVVDGNERQAVGIAFYEDEQANKYLYTGAWSHTVKHDYLVRTDITDINDPNSTEKNLGTEAISMAVDAQTGLVYVTDMNDYGNIKVFNHSTFPSDPCYIEHANISGPADIIVRADVQKEHNVSDCCAAADHITYTITYDANGYADSNVVITDFLPPDVNFISASDVGRYDPNTHTVTWDINDLEPSESNSVTLVIEITALIEPNQTLTNSSQIEGDTHYSLLAQIDANVCCPHIIYVDANATGYNKGISWEHAYTDLQSALNRTRTSGDSQIWVAAATYKPGTSIDDTFELVDGAPLYGGFDASETSLDQRDWLKNETILSGDDQVYDALTAKYLGQATIDGFTITAALRDGIFCHDANLTVRNSTIKANASDGIECSTFSASCSLTLTQSKLISNGDRGVSLAVDFASVITNNWICDNYIDGIYLDNEGPDLIRNNTIAGNGAYGVNAVSLPAYPATVDINNSIIWDNTSGAFDPSWGVSTYNVSYSCVQDCNYVQDPNLHNTCTDPCFVNDPNDPDNYHLGPNSPCKDAIDDPNFYPDDTNETDIDNEPRIMGDCNEFLDMGADEVYFPNCWNCPTQCHGDSDCDANVKGSDFLALSNSWYACYGEPNYNPCADFDRDGC